MFSPEVKVEESLAMKQELLGELFLKESNLRFFATSGTVAMARAMTPSSSTVAIEVRQLTRP